jgi:hypothetical protein
MAKIDVAKFPEYLRSDVEVMLLLGMTAEEIKAKCLELMQARQKAAGSAGNAQQQAVDSEFIQGVKRARLAFDQAERAAKLNGDKAPAKPKVWEADGLGVSLMSGWVTSQLGFNGTVENAKKLLAVLPGYIAAIEAKPEYAELTRFLAVVKPAKK